MMNKVLNSGWIWASRLCLTKYVSAGISTSTSTRSNDQQTLAENSSKKAPTVLAFKDGEDENNSSKKRVEKISRAMVYYLQKKSERDDLMRLKTEEYEIGKRHLARIMGKDPEKFSQYEINVAEYFHNLFRKRI